MCHHKGAKTAKDRNWVDITARIHLIFLVFLALILIKLGEMTMFGESHDIHHDFPQYLDMINQLHDSDSEFKNIYREYHAVNHEIDAIEHNVEPVADHYAEHLKKKRVLLKDQIYARLEASTV